MEGQTVEWIEKKCKRYGLSYQDTEDALQEIAVAVADFQIDPLKTNGATKQTIDKSIAKQQIYSILRQRTRSRRFNIELNKPVIDSMTDVDSRPDENAAICDFISTLSDTEKTIVRELIAGSSIDSIAEQLDLTWHTANRIRNEIRAKIKKHLVLAN